MDAFTARPSPVRLEAYAIALRRVLTAPVFVWALAALFALRDLVLAALEPDRPDTRTFVSAGRALLHDPRSLYVQSSAWLVAHHVNPLPGGLGGFISPPTVAYLFAPLSSLPDAVAVRVWTGLDVLAVVAALLVLRRVLGVGGRLSGFFWLVAAFFPPVFAEFDAGQIGGPLLLLSVLAISEMARRPALAGGLTGVGAALKFYPAILLLAARRGARVRTGAALALVAVALLGLAFLPVGLDWVVPYARNVLYPTLTPGNADCALVSVPTLISRYAGGASWAVPGPDGIRWLHVPWGSVAAARGLTVAVPILLVVLAALAIRRAGYDSTYGGSLALALGCLIPGTVFPYQMLPLLPLVLLLACRAVEDRRWRLGVAVAFCLALFVRPPCDVPVANLWTLGALGAFAVGLTQAGRFRR